MNGDKIFQKLAQACDGLVYISEADAPITAFSSKQTTDETNGNILSQVVGKPDEPIEETTFDLFFERLIAEKDWHGEKEKALVEKFRALKKLLEDNLSELRVIKVGRVRKEIFVVGLDKNKRIVGVQTQSVET